MIGMRKGGTAMLCPYCSEKIPNRSRFCPNCGSALPPDSGKVGTGRKSGAIKWIVIGLLALALVWFGVSRIQASVRRSQVSPEDLSGLVQEVQQNTEEILAFLDPITRNIADDVPVELDSIEARMTCTSILMNHASADSRFHNLSSRKGWDPVKYRAYEELFAAYNKLYAFLGDIYREDPAFGELYARSYLEDHWIPFNYHCDDPAALRASFEALVAEYRACLANIP